LIFMGDMIPILATIVVIATVTTLILAVFSYLAFRTRERRRPVPAEAAAARPRFLVRLLLPEMATPDDGGAA